MMRDGVYFYPCIHSNIHRNLSIQIKGSVYILYDYVVQGWGLQFTQMTNHHIFLF